MTQAARPHVAGTLRINRTTLYFFGALGGILFGYDLGIIAGILVFIAKVWHLNGFQKGVVTASLSVGAMIGAAVAGRLNDVVGRRRTIMIAGVVVIAGTIACASAPNYTFLVIARGVIGIGVGCSSATVPTYLVELAPSKLRGAMGSLNQIFIVTGILIAFLVGYGLNGSADWRAMFAWAILPASILIAGLFFLPETPRFLLKAGDEEQARQVLAKTHPADEIESELATIRDVIRLDEEQKPRIRDLGAPWVRPMLIVALILAIGQQFSGVNAINAYFPTMLVSLGFTTSTALLSAVVLGVTKFLFTAWVVFVVDRWGRKPLLLIGNVVMFVTLMITGYVVLHVHDKNTLGALTLIFLVLYLAGYELGWGAVVWVMMSEVFPLKARATGMGVASVVLWAATGVVTAVFPIMSEKKQLGIGHSMWVFAGVNVILFFLVKWLVPETKGRSLEQIELDLRGRTRESAEV